MPLNSVCSAMRLTSVSSWSTSACMASRSAPVVTPVLAACTDNSRMRSSMVETSLIAPSAVCAREKPSLRLRTTWLRLRVWALSRSAVASPAASSAPELIRLPDASRSLVRPCSCTDWRSMRCVFKEWMLVLSVNMVSEGTSSFRPVP